METAINVLWWFMVYYCVFQAAFLLIASTNRFQTYWNRRGPRAPIGHRFAASLPIGLPIYYIVRIFKK